MPIDNKEIFSANLIYYMTINDVSRPQLSEDLNIKYPTICDWVNGKKYPRIDKIERLAAYFGIPKSELIERHDREQDSGAAHLLSVYNGLNEKGQTKLVEFADDLAASGNYKKSDTLPADIAE